MTCDQLNKADKNDIRIIVSWLNGYYSVENGPQLIEVATLDGLQDQLVKFCARETSFTVAKAAAGIFDH